MKFNDSDLEFVLAVNKDFKFDWKNNIIISKVQDDSIPVSAESLDQPDQKIKIVKTYRNLNSFNEAIGKLNKRAKKMLLRKEDKI
ncbi:hypothetical protein N9164_08305 [Draconibacterium sp.]|nr:hypothetical protein [Draconibacterium sp.]